MDVGISPTGPARIGTVSVSHCARCLGSHDGIPYAAFTHPPEGPGGKLWPYWAVCPETGEPVMLEVGPLKKAPQEGSIN